MRGCLPKDMLLPGRPVVVRLCADEVDWPPRGLFLSREPARGGGGELARPFATAGAEGSLSPAFFPPLRMRGSCGMLLGLPSATSSALIRAYDRESIHSPVGLNPNWSVARHDSRTWSVLQVLPR